MKKWNGKKRIGRKARASRAALSMGLGNLAPGYYTMRVHKIEMVDQSTVRMVTTIAENGRYGKLVTKVKL